MIDLAVVLVLLVAAGGAACLLLTHRVQGETFDSAGTQIHYTDTGQGQAVILLHGFAVNADLQWRRPSVLQPLAEQFRVIAPDLRGHGLSGKPHQAKDYGLEMAHDVIRLMDHLGIEKAHVAGYSLGGFLALKLALTHPDRLISVAPLGSGWENPDRSAFLEAMAETAEELRQGRPIGPLSEKLGAKKQKATWIHRLWVKLMTGYFNDSQALVGVIDGLEELALTDGEVRSIDLPVLGIVGQQDPLVEGALALAERVSDHTLVVVPGADHIRTPFAPEFLGSLQAFFKKTGNVQWATPTH